MYHTPPTSPAASPSARWSAALTKSRRRSAAGSAAAATPRGWDDYGMMELQFFPSRTLAFYMRKAFLVRTIAVLAMLLLVLQTLDLLGESGDILAIRNGQGAALALCSATNSADRRAVPTFLSVTRHTDHARHAQPEQRGDRDEGGGISAHQILAPLVLASLVIACAAFAFNERVVTRSTITLNVGKP